MKKYAFLFGNSFFNDTRLNELNAPENDINALHDVLKSKDICGFDDVDWAVNSTLAAVQTKLVKFLKTKKRDDLIVIYYTGHGLLDDENNLYLALTDSNAEYPDIQSVSAYWLKGKLDRCRSERQLLILDCCHSGAYIGGTKSSTDTLAINNETFERQGYGRYVLASSSRTQFSIESGGESLYTKAIVEGLKKGKAALGKEWISIADLEEYLAGKFSTAAAPMRPESTVRQKIGQLVIAANPFFVDPVPPKLLKSLLDENPKIRLGAVVELRMLAESTTSAKRRDEVMNALRERLDPDAVDTEDSRTVAREINRALDILNPPESKPLGLVSAPIHEIPDNVVPPATADSAKPSYKRWLLYPLAGVGLVLGVLLMIGIFFPLEPEEIELAQGGITEIENKMQKTELQAIQRAICVKADGIFDGSTRSGILVVEQMSWLSPANGEITDQNTLMLLTAVASSNTPCDTKFFRNFLERKRFSDKRQVQILVTALNAVSSDTPIKLSETLNDEIRGKIRRIRKEFSIEPGIRGFGAQVTLALLQKINFANTVVPEPGVVVVEPVENNTPPPGFDQVQRDDPPWLKTAFAELAKGVRETSNRSNPEIDKYFRQFGIDLNQKTPWSGAFIAWCIANSSDAGLVKSLPEIMFVNRNYTNWGAMGLGFHDKIPRGALVISSGNNNPSGRSGFFLARDGNQVVMLSGNFKNEVAVNRVDTGDILAIRWMDPPKPTGRNISLPFSAQTWDTYKAAMGSSVAISDGYKSINRYEAIGRYQFAAPGLWVTGYVKKGIKTSQLKNNNNWTGKDGIKSVKDWLNNPEVQDRALMALAVVSGKNVIRKLGAVGYKATKFDIETEFMPLLAVSHIFGSGAVVDLLTGKKDHKRKDGILASEVYREFAIRYGGTAKLPKK